MGCLSSKPKRYSTQTDTEDYGDDAPPPNVPAGKEKPKSPAEEIDGHGETPPSPAPDKRNVILLSTEKSALVDVIRIGVQLEEELRKNSLADKKQVVISCVDVPQNEPEDSRFYDFRWKSHRFQFFTDSDIQVYIPLVNDRWLSKRNTQFELSWISEAKLLWQARGGDVFPIAILTVVLRNEDGSSTRLGDGFGAARHLKKSGSDENLEKARLERSAGFNNNVNILSSITARWVRQEMTKEQMGIAGVSKIKNPKINQMEGGHEKAKEIAVEVEGAFSPEMIARELMHHCMFVAFKVIKIQRAEAPEDGYRKKNVVAREVMRQIEVSDVNSEPEEVMQTVKGGKAGKLKKANSFGDVADVITAPKKILEPPPNMPHIGLDFAAAKKHGAGWTDSSAVDRSAYAKVLNEQEMRKAAAELKAELDMSASALEISPEYLKTLEIKSQMGGTRQLDSFPVLGAPRGLATDFGISLEVTGATAPVTGDGGDVTPPLLNPDIKIHDEMVKAGSKGGNHLAAHSLSAHANAPSAASRSPSKDPVSSRSPSKDPRMGGSHRPKLTIHSDVAGPGNYKVGDRLVVQGLTNNPEYNGVFVKVMSIHNDAARTIEVTIPSRGGQRLLLKSEYLIPLQDPKALFSGLRTPTSKDKNVNYKKDFNNTMGSKLPSIHDDGEDSDIDIPEQLMTEAIMGEARHLPPGQPPVRHGHPEPAPPPGGGVPGRPGAGAGNVYTGPNMYDKNRVSRGEMADFLPPVYCPLDVNKIAKDLPTHFGDSGSKGLGQQKPMGFPELKPSNPQSGEDLDFSHSAVDFSPEQLQELNRQTSAQGGLSVIGQMSLTGTSGGTGTSGDPSIGGARGGQGVALHPPGKAGAPTGSKNLGGARRGHPQQAHPNAPADPLAAKSPSLAPMGKVPSRNTSKDPTSPPAGGNTNQPLPPGAHIGATIQSGLGGKHSPAPPKTAQAATAGAPGMKVDFSSMNQDLNATNVSINTSDPGVDDIVPPPQQTKITLDKSPQMDPGLGGLPSLNSMKQQQKATAEMTSHVVDGVSVGHIDDLDPSLYPVQGGPVEENQLSKPKKPAKLLMKDGVASSLDDINEGEDQDPEPGDWGLEGGVGTSGSAHGNAGKGKPAVTPAMFKQIDGSAPPSGGKAQPKGSGPGAPSLMGPGPSLKAGATAKKMESHKTEEKNEEDVYFDPDEGLEDIEKKLAHDRTEKAKRELYKQRSMMAAIPTEASTEQIEYFLSLTSRPRIKDLKREDYKFKMSSVDEKGKMLTFYSPFICGSTLKEVPRTYAGTRFNWQLIDELRSSTLNKYVVLRSPVLKKGVHRNAHPETGGTAIGAKNATFSAMEPSQCGAMRTELQRPLWEVEEERYKNPTSLTDQQLLDRDQDSKSLRIVCWSSDVKYHKLKAEASKECEHVIKAYTVLRNSLQKSRTDHVAAYFGYDFNHQSNLYLYSEYIDGGTVADRLAMKRLLNKKSLMKEEMMGAVQSTIALSERECRYIIMKVLKGLEQLHHLELVHGALRPSNIAINRYTGKVQLCDWGLWNLRRCMNDERECYVRRHCRWMAPELFKSGKLTRKADMWALGCTLIEMITGNPPYTGGTMKKNMNDEDIFTWLRNGHHIPGIPAAGATPECVDFLGSCLTYDHTKRPDTDSNIIKLHAFRKENRTLVQQYYEMKAAQSSSGHHENMQVPQSLAGVVSPGTAGLSASFSPGTHHGSGTHGSGSYRDGGDHVGKDPDRKRVGAAITGQPNLAAKMAQPLLISHPEAMRPRNNVRAATGKRDFALSFGGQNQGADTSLLDARPNVPGMMPAAVARRGMMNVPQGPKAVS